MISLTTPQLNASLVWTQGELDFLTTHGNATRSDIFTLSKIVSQKILHQLFARQNAKQKCPFLYANENIVYPVSLSIEQSSSERTAAFKASLFQGETFIDLSGGFGVDAYFFAKQFHTGIVVERNTALAQIVSHNFCLLNQHNIQFAIGVNAEQFINEYKGTCNLIYIDPARRNNEGKKIVRLSDCEPDVVKMLPQLFSISNEVLIKTSPLLDIDAACEELKYVKKVYVVAVENECKELLFHLEKDFMGAYTIHAINIEKGSQIDFSFLSQDEMNADSTIGSIKKYVYEPNAAILKSGGFKSVGTTYRCTKLHVNSHLYSSDKLIHDFPGRRFEILHRIKVDKKKIQALIPDGKANVSIRNFPGTVDALKKKLGLKDGGDIYLFATTDFENNKIVLICKKV